MFKNHKKNSKKIQNYLHFLEPNKNKTENRPKTVLNCNKSVTITKQFDVSKFFNTNVFLTQTKIFQKTGKLTDHPNLTRSNTQGRLLLKGKNVKK